MMPAVHDMQKDLINAITENLKWVVRTEQMIFAKKTRERRIWSSSISNTKRKFVTRFERAL